MAKNNAKQQNFITKLPESVLEVFNWLKIAASPTLTGVAIGVVLYIYKPDTTGLIISGLFAAIGLGIGIYLEVKISRRSVLVSSSRLAASLANCIEN